MHVGCSVVFQNPLGLPDEEVYAEELKLAELAEPLGFDSLWTVEHHFTDYTMCPDPLQFLTWMAGRTTHIKLGTSVIVLPWHDPIRVAENITVLDNLSDGRLILGIGRGLARVEYEGFRVDMNTSRERFVEHAEAVIEALDRGYMEYDGELLQQPRRELRPRPRFSFRGRTYAAAVSPESMPIMARLGVGLLVIPQKPWDSVKEDFEVYGRIWAEENPGEAQPAPLSGGFVVVHEDAAKAEELAYRYIGGYYETVLRHYELAANPHAGVKGYEFYTYVSRHIERHGEASAIEAFVDLMPWGTPEQVVEKVAFIRDTIGIAGFLPNFAFAGMPYADAERSLRLFAAEVMPELKRWDTGTVPDPEPAGLAVG